MGICGGYQMLGTQIHDPQGIEDTAGSSQGFNLLDVETSLQAKKQLVNVSGNLTHLALKHALFNGYEIHCGTTQIKTSPVLTIDDSRTDGAISEDNNVLGTYIHGLFDNPESAEAILHWAGLNVEQSVNIDQIREQQLERLANTLEEHFHAEFLESFQRAASKEH